MTPRSRRAMPALPLIIALLLLAACTPRDISKGSLAGTAGNLATATAEPEKPSEPTLALGDNTIIAIAGAESPMLSLLVQGYTVASESAVLTALENGEEHGKAADPAAVTALVGRATAVTANLAAISPEALKASPLFRAAHEAGVPIVLEHVDAERMAAVTGFGVDATAVVIQPQQGGTEVIITVLGEAGNSEVSAEAGESLTVASKTGSDGVPQPEKEIPAPPTEEQVTTDPAALAAEVVSILSKQAAQRPARTPGSAAIAQSLPYSAARIWYVNFPVRYWYPGYTQRASSYANFRVELYDTVSPDNKWLAIATDGVLSPGALAWNAYEDRGFFQEKVELEFGPMTSPAGLAIDRHGPATQRGAGQAQTGTGFSVTMGGSGPVASYGAPRTENLPLANFTLTNQTAGTKARWTVEMAQVGTNVAYTTPLALVCPTGCEQPNVPGLYALPTAARVDLSARNQVVWKVPGDFQARVPFRFWYKQTLREVWRTQDGSGYTFSHTARAYTRWLAPSYIDFSVVNY